MPATPTIRPKNAQYFFQSWRLKRTNNATYSRRPRIIKHAKSNLLDGDTDAKFSVGPISAKAGPTFPKQLITADIAPINE